MEDSGHGVCEYMGATHSSQHTVLDAQQITQPAVAKLMRNASTEQRQTNDSIHNSSHNIHAQSKAVKQDHIRTFILSYNYHNSGPEQPDLKSNELTERTSANTHTHKKHMYGILDSLTPHADFAAGYKYRKDVFELLHKASSLQTQSIDLFLEVRTSMSYVSPSSTSEGSTRRFDLYNVYRPDPTTSAARTPRNYQPTAVHSELVLRLYSKTTYTEFYVIVLGRAKAKRCRIHLSKRHRFAIANFKYHLLTNSSLRLDFFFQYDVALTLASGSSIDWFYCSFLLIVMSLLMSSSLIQLLHFSSQLLIAFAQLLITVASC
ncbi:hypothetical protein F511_34369 [Dorcoceras hygrometricum]|uniref:Uncharacterized protein n=1 Tax=Dorcoceras hygrometricum TaxID=472368 RepID=A0A2Z7CVP2_9LAMI|nr:hypothetical protein F511_34369 [Dorcoceras hygrometricum]